MITAKRIWRVLTIVLVLGTGCALSTSPKNNGINVYSYSVDEIAAGLFGAMSPTMTMNDWYWETRPWTPETYDSWSQREKVYLYKDKDLQMPFAGSDILDEDTVIYSDFSFNGQGKQTGKITGTITLTDIPDPAATRIYISSSSYNGFPENWWSLNRKINMNGVTGTTAQLNWSLSVYESLKPNSEATFTLTVLPGNSLKAYTVSVPTRKTISNANVGDLGTVSVRGVTLSGTITVTDNGQPVPYVEIYANYPVQGTLGITCLYSPGPDAPWSVTFGPDNNNNKEMEFKVLGYSEKNGDWLFDRFVTVTPTVYVRNNQDVSGIVLNSN